MPYPASETDSAGGPEGSARLQPCSLVVDDDAGICTAISFTLKKMGFEALEIGSLGALEAALQSRRPQIVFLDLNLGRSGPTEAFQVLTRHGYEGPVQIMSGKNRSSLSEAVALGRSYGLNMLPALAKPFRMGVVRTLAASLAPSAVESRR